MRYQDFVVQIGLLPGGQLQARVLRSPAGEGEGSQALPRSLAELAFSPFGCDPLQPDDDSPSRNLVRRAAPPKNAGEVGRDLHDLLFAGTVGRLWEQSLGSLRGRPDEGLRLRLQFDLAASAGLGELPWELLFRADTASYLSLDRQTPVLRHLEVAQPVLPQPLPPSLKVVGVASSPSEMATLDLATEKQELESQRRKRRRWQVSFLAKPTIEALRRTLVEQGSHVLHFMGHGGFDSESGEGVLYFVDDQGVEKTLIICRRICATYAYAIYQTTEFSRAFNNIDCVESCKLFRAVRVLNEPLNTAAR